MNDKEKIKIENKEDRCVIKVNSKIYPLDVIFSAAYVFIDKVYVLIEGDPEKEICVLLKPKKNQNIENVGEEFYNELLNCLVYKEQGSKNKKIRETIIQRALITNDPSIITEEDIFEKDIDEYLEDVEGIAIPWEEKYGKKSK
jgi:His-Xaa-Ser system protein HxsD